MTSFDNLVLWTLVGGGAFVGSAVCLCFAVAAGARGDRLRSATLCLIAATFSVSGSVSAFVYSCGTGTLAAWTVVALVVTVLLLVIQAGIWLAVRAEVGLTKRPVE